MAADFGLSAIDGKRASLPRRQRGCPAKGIATWPGFCDNPFWHSAAKPLRNTNLTWPKVAICETDQTGSGRITRYSERAAPGCRTLTLRLGEATDVCS